MRWENPRATVIPATVPRVGKAKHFPAPPLPYYKAKGRGGEETKNVTHFEFRKMRWHAFSCGKTFSSPEAH